jgi:hypothetical protein
VIKDTPQNPPLIGISDIFLLELYYKQLTPTMKGKTQMSINGYTYQIGDLFTTSKTGVTGRIAGFTPMSNKVTRVSLVLSNGSRRLAMVKTSK